MQHVYKVTLEDYNYAQSRVKTEYETAESGLEALELVLGRQGVSVHVDKCTVKQIDNDEDK